MQLNLRPLNMGELFDAAIGIYRKNFITLFGIVVLVTAPVLLAQVAATLLILPLEPLSGRAGLSGSAYAISTLVYYGVLFVVGLLGGILALFQIGALASAVSDAYHHRATNIKQAYVQALRHWASLLLVLIILGGLNLVVLGLIFLPFLSAVALPAVAGSGSSGSAEGALIAAMLLPLSCLCFFPALFLVILFDTRLAFSFHAVILENLNAAAALRRSWNLVGGPLKGPFWRILLTLALLALFVYLISAGPIYLATFGAIALIPSSLTLMTVVTSVVQSVIGALIMPIQLAVITLLYYDMRVRKEGYDLELQVRQLEQSLPLPGAEQSA